ncbi:hypothetical protein LCL87_21145 [Rhodococcus hoagii]|nr:hypothetical protein [Prescottella equi]
MTTTDRQRTFVLLWDGSGDTYPDEERVEHEALTAKGLTAPVTWSFGQGFGNPRAGDRVYLHRTGKKNGIVASGWLVSDEVFWGPHWSDADAEAPYVFAEWDVLVDTDHRLPYESMKSLMPEFKFPILHSGREVPAPSDKALADAWDAHIVDLSSRMRNPWLGGRPAAGPQRASGACKLEEHTTRVYGVPAFASTEAVKEEAALVSTYVKSLRDIGHTVTGYRIQHAGPVRPLRVDVYDQTDHVLYEAKASSSREAVRMALGQLLDYRRAFDIPPELRVLLPERPSEDLVDLLAEHKVRCVYPTGDGSFQSE